MKKVGGNKWSVDHLFIDQDGIPTLVEVKRSTDTRIRREVVGQMLDYAANSVMYWNIDQIKERFENNCDENGLDPELEISELIGAEADIDKYWETVNTNIHAGKVRLLFIADKIPKELQRIIEFLNEQMSPAEVLGFEIKQYGNDEIRTLVPRVIGKTTDADIKKEVKRSERWTREDFSNELRKNHGQASVDTALKILDRIENAGATLYFGMGKVQGIITPYLPIGKKTNVLFAVATYGKIEIQFQHLKKNEPFSNIEMRKVLLNKLRRIKGVEIPDDSIDRRPSFFISALNTQEKVNSFVDCFVWVIDEIRNSQGAL